MHIAAYNLMNNSFSSTFFALKISVLTLPVLEVRDVQYLNRKIFFLMTKMLMSGFSLEISYLQIYKGSKGQLCLEQLNPQV